MRREAGTMLGLMGRGDTAAGRTLGAGLLGTMLCGHSVEPGEGRNQRRVCEKSVDTGQ